MKLRTGLLLGAAFTFGVVAAPAWRTIAPQLRIAWSTAPLMGLPVSFDGVRPLPRSASPALGAHTAEVLGT